MPLFGKKKEKEKKKGDARKPPSPESPPRYAQTAGRNSTSPKPSPSSSLQNLPRKDGKDGGVGAAAGRGVRRDAQYVGSVKDKVTQYEQKRGVISASYTSLNSRERSVASPPPSSSTTTSQHSSHASLLRPDVRSQGGSSLSSGTSPAPDQVTINVPTSTSSTTTYQPSSLCGFESPPAITETPPPAAKLHDGHHLPLPPLQTATVQHRHVVAEKNQQNGGGFGFILRQSYLPVPEDPGQTRLVHLVEPRPDYMGPLMTGDRIIEVNGSVVEDEPHDKVVELIKASGDRVELMVASMPELHELNARVFQGSDNPFANRGSNVRKSTKMKPGQTGTLRKQAAKAKKEFKVHVYTYNVYTYNVVTSTNSGDIYTVLGTKRAKNVLLESFSESYCMPCTHKIYQNVPQSLLNDRKYIFTLLVHMTMCVHVYMYMFGGFMFMTRQTLVDSDTVRAHESLTTVYRHHYCRCIVKDLCVYIYLSG